MFEFDNPREFERTKHFPCSAFALLMSLLVTLPQTSQAVDLFQNPEATISSIIYYTQVTTSNISPEVQMELLNDIEHVTFDLASFVTHQDLVLQNIHFNRMGLLYFYQQFTRSRSNRTRISFSDVNAWSINNSFVKVSSATL